jgi:D-alanyl-D-alanine dipeptidase
MKRAALIALWLAASPAAASDLPAGFVRLTDVAPRIAADIRYATPFNFTAAPVPGYRTGACILTRQAADALARAEAILAADGFGLKVMDCYRPARAVAAFVAWAERGGGSQLAIAFHPDIPQERLIAEGFIARRSAHSRGSTVDVTLIDRSAPSMSKPVLAGACDGPFDHRHLESTLDLGTTFDCFSARAATGFEGLPAAARRNRERLVSAMEQAGFRNYPREWWHFTLRDEPFPRTIFDFEVR